MQSLTGRQNAALLALPGKTMMIHIDMQQIRFMMIPNGPNLMQQTQGESHWKKESGIAGIMMSLYTHSDANSAEQLCDCRHHDYAHSDANSAASVLAEQLCDK
eukprot:6491983-Amphidinium_carterae.2